MDIQSIFYTLGIIFITLWLIVLSAGLVLIFIIIKKVQAFGHQASEWSEGVNSFMSKLNSKPVGIMVTLLPLMPIIMGILNRKTKKG